LAHNKRKTIKFDGLFMFSRTFEYPGQKCGIYEVRIYDYPLADDMIKKVMASPSGMAVEPNGKLANTWGQLKSER